MIYIKTLEGLFKKSGSLTDYDIKMSLIELEDIGLMINIERIHSAIEGIFINIEIHKGNPTGLVLRNEHNKSFNITEEMNDIILTFLDYVKSKNITLKSITIQNKYSHPMDDGATIFNNIKRWEERSYGYNEDVFAITIKLKIY